MSITDSNGSQITLDTSAPRVVAAYGSFAEAWLLAGGELVGVTQDAVEDRDLGLPKDVAVVGTVKEPNAEEIIALEPDLVLLAQDNRRPGGHPGPAGKRRAPLRHLPGGHLRGLRLYDGGVLPDHRPEDLYEENVEKPREQIEEARDNRRPGGRPAPCAADPGLLHRDQGQDRRRAGRGHFTGLGGSQHRRRPPLHAGGLELEEVIQADPDYIFVTTMGDEQKALDYLNGLIQENPAWSGLSAVKGGRYVVLPKDLFHYKPNHRWGESYQYLGEILYPEAFHAG